MVREGDGGRSFCGFNLRRLSFYGFNLRGLSCFGVEGVWETDLWGVMEG